MHEALHSWEKCRRKRATYPACAIPLLSCGQGSSEITSQRGYIADGISGIIMVGIARCANRHDLSNLITTIENSVLLSAGRSSHSKLEPGMASHVSAGALSLKMPAGKHQSIEI